MIQQSTEASGLKVYVSIPFSVEFLVATIIMKGCRADDM